MSGTSGALLRLLHVRTAAARHLDRSGRSRRPGRQGRAAGSPDASIPAGTCTRLHPGGIPTSVQVGPDAVVERSTLLQPAPKRAFDPNFGSDTETYEGDVVFLLD